jgi:hypothetical protein
MEKGSKKPMGKGRPQQGVVQDPRFASIHVDPRFRKFPKQQGKVEIDQRFASES